MKYREVRLHCRLKSPPIPREALVAFTLDVLGRLKLEGEVGLRLCSTRTMASFNRRFRGVKGATNVLAFPNGEKLPAGGIYLGDILIAAPVAEKSAREVGDTLENELKRLVLHGVLHLVGYDHESDKGKMARKERGLRREWGLA